MFINMVILVRTLPSLGAICLRVGTKVVIIIPQGNI